MFELSMPENFEQFHMDSREIQPARPKGAKEKSAMTRREFLKGAGILAAGGAVAALGLEKTRRALPNYWDLMMSEIPDEKDRQIGEKHIEAEDLSKTINYDEPVVRLELKRIQNLKEYWKKRYQDPDDPERLNQRSKSALENMRKWDNDLKEAFIKYGNPPELRYISIVESDFERDARSHAGAVGYFQFMKKTARGYGLKVDPPSVDERKDPLKSGRAASRYLSDLFAETKDRKLALSKYNGGFVKRYMAEESEQPSYEKFLKFLERELNALKSEIKEDRYWHTVLPGQTLERVAKYFDISMGDLKNNNRDILSQHHVLRAYDRLKIPFRDEAHKGKIFHKRTAGFRENINFPHQIEGLTEAIQEGKI